MSIDPVEQIKLIGEFFNTLPELLYFVENTSQQEYATELLSFFELIKKLKSNYTDVASDIKAFMDEPTIGMRVHYTHRAGGNINEFKSSCVTIIEWLWQHTHWREALKKISSTQVKKIVANTHPKDDYATLEFITEINKDVKYEQPYDIVIILTSLQYELQAVRSPDPKLFPDEARIKKIAEQIMVLQDIIFRVVVDIREFAISHIKTEDFFTLE